MSETPEISVYESTFAQSNKTDAILVVDGKKLHVNKTLLSYHSNYFNTLFNGEFKEKSMTEIAIEDVNFYIFATLLSLLQHNPIEITRWNSANLLKLADRFLLPYPKSLVENFIWTSSEFERIDKLKLADKYKLDSLLERVIALYTRPADFSELSYNRNKDISEKLQLRMAKLYFGMYFNS
ncbi:hypothetical protein CRE_19794 [Caenorhabditis remanei]|uniref:BTB domain-containing protein n=1 Tax=Caenorhabditis remanei TaxID=31234 RepID=E3MTC0_CAERE|nr:hypothetical protein CRE_19794 [Caenorhabditis remanei]